MRSWVFGNDRVNFGANSSIAPTVAALPPVSFPVIPTAAAFDENNNVLFRVSLYGGNGLVIDQNGNTVGSLSAAGYNQWGPEATVVPVPGYCRRFYVIYGQYNLNTAALGYAIIDCGSGSPQIIQNTVLIDSGFSNYVAMAVSKPSGNARTLYAMANYQGIRRYTITSTGISSGSQDQSFTGTLMYGAGELDISPDGSALAWVSGSTGYTLGINPSTKAATGQLTSYPLPTGGGRGVEFGPSDFGSEPTRVFYSAGGAGATSGVYAVDRTTGQVNYVAGSTNLFSSQLEMAHDGLIYAIGNSGSAGATLHTINPATLAVAASPVTLNLSGAYSAAGNIYRLPDQIDGEDYSYFFGVPRPSTGILKLNNGTLTTTGARKLYNCSPITLTQSGTNVTSWRVTITATLPDGTPQPGTYLHTTNWAAALPSDIRTLDNNYLLTHTGYFQIKTEGADQCGYVVPTTGRFEVNSLPTAALSFNYGDGSAPSSPSNNPQTPVYLGQNNSGLNITYSSGLNTTYQVTFEQYVNGLYTWVGQTPAQSLYTSPTTVGLNDLAQQAGLGSGYFANPDPVSGGANKLFRLTLRASNPCGSSNDVQSFFQPIDPNYRPGAEVTAVSAYPNPLVDGQGQLVYQLKQRGPVTLRVLDAITGKPVLTLLAGERQEAGEHRVRFDASALPKGVYVYQLVTDRVATGRLTKAE